jgi:hypothetical protein
MRAPLLLVLTSLAIVGHAQVLVDRPVVLNGTGPEDRQLTSALPTLDPGAVLVSSTEVEGTLRHVLPAYAATWVIDLPSAPGAPLAGTHLLLRVPAAGAGPVAVLLNGTGPYAVEWTPGEALLGSALQADQELSLVFDGNGFQVIGGLTRALRNCPAGMVTVNEQFCIEPANRPAALLDAASVTCANLARRICSWAEFHAACARQGELGVSTTSNDWEWTNNTANEDLNARVVKLNDCGNAGTRNAVTVAAPFRCCYTR